MNQEYLKIGENFSTENPYFKRDTRKIFRQRMSELDYSVEDKVKYCMSLFGWDGRKRPESKQVIQDMEQVGYYIFPAARIFLERFAGLRIRYGNDFEIPFVSTSFNVYNFCFCEAMQLFKNELLVPVAMFDEMRIFLGESGKVHYWVSDTTGIIPTNMFSVFSSMVFDLEEDIWFLTTPEERKEVLWWDGDLIEQIETKVNNGSYVPYAQKRFAQNDGIPNPIMATDAFTQWLLSFE